MRRTFLLAALLLGGCTLLGRQEHFVVFFPSHTAALDAQARQVIAGVAEKAKLSPGAPVNLAGYTGPKGAPTIAGDFRLATQRTIAVADALVALGIDPARIRTHAVGGVDYSLDSIESRRVEITIGDESR
jgi:outer membrane protein OmpA-like peptidoglycan-associated protein